MERKVNRMIQERSQFRLNDKILMRKLTDVLLQEKLITPNEKVKILKLLKEGDAQ